MGLDVGLIKEIEYLEHPSDKVKDFISEIINDDNFCNCWGSGGALVFAMKDEMQKRAKEYATSEELPEINKWIDSLPWDNDYIRLYFNW